MTPLMMEYSRDGKLPDRPGGTRTRERDTVGRRQGNLQTVEVVECPTPRGEFREGISTAALVGTDYAERINDDVQLFGVFLDLNIANAKGLPSVQQK